MSSHKNTNQPKMPQPVKKSPIKTLLRHTVKVFRVIDKGLDLGVRIFDYVVKVSKVAALFLGATTAVYVAKEMPNRSETDTVGDVVERAVDNMGADVSRVVNRTCPRFSRPRPPRDERMERPQNKPEKTSPQKISTHSMPVLSMKDWQNIR